MYSLAQNVHCSHLSSLLEDEARQQNQYLTHLFEQQTPSFKQSTYGRLDTLNSREQLCDLHVTKNKGQVSFPFQPSKSELYLKPCTQTPSFNNSLNCVKNECCSYQHQTFMNCTRNKPEKKIQ